MINVIKMKGRGKKRKQSKLRATLRTKDKKKLWERGENEKKIKKKKSKYRKCFEDGTTLPQNTAEFRALGYLVTKSLAVVRWIRGGKHMHACR